MRCRCLRCARRPSTVPRRLLFMAPVSSGSVI
ncbi:hypothetical protein E2C01_088455 [Portunus trituberculatus]|uniref:Uncharacterized protein n=1 Tax=Portunus trituberculatus TaxID=210409 RepID=A0A5B7J683_PORTR|nr:hypothetical protein [Portunus trituberculatus]